MFLLAYPQPALAIDNCKERAVKTGPSVSKQKLLKATTVWLIWERGYDVTRGKTASLKLKGDIELRNPAHVA